VLLGHKLPHLVSVAIAGVNGIPIIHSQAKDDLTATKLVEIVSVAVVNGDAAVLL
jgi:hypothetical protein